MLFNFVCFQGKTPEYPSIEEIKELQFLGKISDPPLKEEIFKVWQEKYKRLSTEANSSDSDLPESESSGGKEMMSDSSDSSIGSLNVGCPKQVSPEEVDGAGATNELKNISVVEPVCNGPIEECVELDESSSGNEGDVLARSPECMVGKGKEASGSRKD